MKKLISTVIIMLLVAYFVIVKRTTVAEGTEAVIIDKPWFIGKSGIEKRARANGVIWHFRSTEVKLIPIYPFGIKEEMKGVLTLDNIPISFNMVLTFKNIAGKTPLLVEQFGSNNQWYVNLLQKPLQNTVTIFVKKQKFESIFNDEKIMLELQDSVRYGVEDFLKKYRIPIQLISVNIEKISPPQEIIAAAIKTQVEKQNAKTEEAKIETEKLRQLVQEAKVKNDRLYMRKMNLTPRQYIELKRIELESKRLENQLHALECAKDSNGSIKVRIDMGKS